MTAGKRMAVLSVLFLGGVATAPALAAPPAKAAAPMSKQQCLAAHEEAIALKTDKKPHAAHEKLVLCAKVECPNIVKKECTEQLDVVAAAAPTVVLEALDDKGGSDTAVKVTLDGSPAADKLTGAALDVEPGEHVFVFERADGKKIETQVLVGEGEKNRKITADFQTLLPKKPDGPIAPPPPPKKVPILAYVAGGVALVGFGSFAAFSIMGRGKESDLANGGSVGCEPNCTNAQISPIKRDYIIGDVSLGVGIFALAAAVVLALPALSSSSPKPQARLTNREPAPWMPRVRIVQ